MVNFLTKHKFEMIFFIISFSIFFGSALKIAVPYLNYYDEFFLIFILFFFIKENLSFKIIKNLSIKGKVVNPVSLYLIYVVFIFTINNTFNFPEILRLKYYLFSILLFYITYKKINFEVLERLLIIILFISVLFGIHNLIFGEFFLKLFYESPDKLDLNYRGKPIRLISLLNSPIIFGFVLNYLILQILFRYNLNLVLKLACTLCIIFLIMLTYSRLAYIYLFIAIIAFMYLQKKYLYIFLIFLTLFLFLLFSSDILIFLHSKFSMYNFYNNIHSIFKRTEDIYMFKYFDNYIQQFYISTPQNFNELLLFTFGNGFDDLGWSGSKYLLESSILSIHHEIGLVGLILAFYICFDYFRVLKLKKNNYENILFTLFITYIILNNGFIHNPISYVFFLNYFKLLSESEVFKKT